MATKEQERQALQSAELGDKILTFAKENAQGMNPGQIGAALASATVYYGRECGLDDLTLIRVWQAAMAKIDGRQIGPVAYD